MTKVAIIGSRNCKNFDIEIIKKYLPENCTLIISGGAAGIDKYAQKFALKNNIAFKEYPPDYEKYGKRAPIQRNIEIVENADEVLAFWDCYSKGTAHTINHCIVTGTPVRIIPLKVE